MNEPLLSQEPAGAGEARTQNGSASTSKPPERRARGYLPQLPTLRAVQRRFMTTLHRDRPVVVESLDYMPVENEFYFARQRARHDEKHLWGYSGKTLAKFVLTVMTGSVVGLLAYLIASIHLQVIQRRNAALQDIIETQSAAAAQLFFTAFCLSLVVVASLLVVYVAPAASGAGVSLVMAFLNGAHIPNLLRPSTLLVKAIGLVLGVSSNLAIGPEGPMVHLGAAVASTLAHNDAYLVPGRVLRTLRCSVRSALRFLFSARSRFQRSAREPEEEPDSVDEISILDHEPGFTDADHREFVSAGVAAGIAAAFGAPIGGVLFSMEEASTFWSRRVALRCFLCAVSASFVISQLNSRVEVGLLSFESITYPGHREFLFQLPLVVLTAVVCGGLGATFNVIRRALWAVRASRTRPLLRLLEAAGVCVATCLIFFAAGRHLGTCTETNGWISERAKGFGVRLQCPEGTQNDVATLLLSSPEETIRQIFSLSSSVGTGPSASVTTRPCTPSSCLFTEQGLLVVAASYLIAMSLACGVAVPGGLFLPSIMVGASSGALLGMSFQRMMPSDWTVEPGVFALVGATATLAGVFRSSISLVVIVVEGTHGVDFLFPLIITALVANWAAALIHKDGVYESELERDGTVFFLRHGIPRSLKRIQVKEIMSSRPVTLQPVESLETILTALRTTPHNGFPVVTRPPQDADVEAGSGPSTSSESDSPCVLEGSILRSQLLVLLKRRAFCDAQGHPVHLPSARLFAAAGLPLSPPNERESQIDRDSSVEPADSLPPLPPPTATVGFTSLPGSQGIEYDREMRGFYSQGPGKSFNHRRHLLSTSEATDAILIDYLIEEQAHDRAASGNRAGARGTYSPPLLTPTASLRALRYNAPFSPTSGPAEPPSLPLSPSLGPGTPASVSRFAEFGRNRSRARTASLLNPSDLIRAEIDALKGLYVDLRPFFDRSPITIMEDASAARAYHVFLSLSLRHLFVLRRGKAGGLVGVVTRKDLRAAADE